MNDQSFARTSPLSLTTNVGPQSRIHASLEVISTTRISGGRTLRAWAYCAGLTHMVTGSNSLIAFATFAKTFCAGFAPSRQLSGRSGQSIHICF